MTAGPASHQVPRQAARPLIAPMRWILLIGGFFVFVAGFQLFVLTERTERFFAWTIQPPVTAATLGAFYWATWVLALLSAREHSWDRARLGVPALVPFLLLTLGATLLHIDRFHLRSDDPVTLVVTWAWILIYALQPVILLIVLPFQLRVPGDDPVSHSAPPRPFRVALLVQAVIALAVGIALFAAPQSLLESWPWMLTALTARALGAWFFAFGILFGTVAWEHNWDRTGSGMVALSVLGVLLLAALIRFPSDVDSASRATWAYVALCLSVLAVGLYGWRQSRRGDRAA
jgi:hypothetical protein